MPNRAARGATYLGLRQITPLRRGFVLLARGADGKIKSVRFGFAAQEKHSARVHVRIGEGADFPAVEFHRENRGEHARYPSAHHRAFAAPRIDFHDERNAHEILDLRFGCVYAFSYFPHA